MANLIETFLNKSDNDTCIYFENNSFTYKETFLNIKKMMQYLLKLGITNNDVVTIALPNIPQMVFVLYALDTIGATINIVHPFTKRIPLFNLMKKVNSKVLITSGTKYKQEEFKNITILVANPLKFSNKLYKYIYDIKIKKSHCTQLDLYINEKPKRINIHKRKPGEDAMLLSSSGTTGTPKIVKLSTDALINMSKKLPFITYSELSNKAMLAVLPIFHCFGLAMGVVAPLYNHMIVTLMIRFNVTKVAKQINKKHINFMIGVPRMYEKLYDYHGFKKANLAQLELCFVGGDKITKEFTLKFNELLNKRNSLAKLLQGYGLTEALVCVVNNKLENKIGSLGKPMQDNEMFIVDENEKICLPNVVGEIVLKTNSIMNGYYDDNQNVTYKNIKNSIKTGDLGYIDDQGFLFYKERKKRLFKISGVNVFPNEVEEIVRELPEIKDAAIVFYNVPKAHTILFVSLTKSIKKDKMIKKINNYLEPRLIRYSLPKEIKIIENIPKNTLGKTNYLELENKSNQ